MAYLVSDDTFEIKACLRRVVDPKLESTKEPSRACGGFRKRFPTRLKRGGPSKMRAPPAYLKKFGTPPAQPQWYQNHCGERGTIQARGICRSATRKRKSADEETFEIKARLQGAVDPRPEPTKEPARACGGFRKGFPNPP